MRHALFSLLLIAFAFALPSCSSQEPTPDTTPSEQEPAKANDANEQITDRMAEEHADDEPVPSEATEQAPSSDVVTQKVEYFTRAGEPITGYLARPKGETEDLPALVVIHEWWGLNDNIRAMTRRLAGEGYLALAVDLYNGKTAETPDKARQLMGNVMKNDKAALVNLSAARQWLEREYDTRAMGIIGWCFGGGWSLRGALNMKENVDAAVVYYGEVVTDESKLADLQAPLLGIFAADDQAVPVEKVREFEQALDKLGKDAQINIYEDVGHAFANPSGKNYAPDKAEKAWNQTLTFLDKHLKK